MQRMKKILVVSAVVVACLLLVALVGALILWRAALVVPDFYAQALAASETTRREHSDAMLQKTITLVGDVRRSGEWEALFTEAEINGWLAVDLVENHSQSLPPEVADPRIVVTDGGLLMGCRARTGGVETVLSLAVDAYLTEPNVLALRVRSARAGAIPLPLGDVLDQIAATAHRSGMRVQWQQAGGDPVALVRLNWEVKDRPVIVESLEVGSGEIYLAGSTHEPEKE